MENWKEDISGNYIDLINGFAFKSKNFIKEQVKNSLPVIKIKNVANGDVNLNDVDYHLINESLEKYIISKGDVLIAMTGNHPQSNSQVVGDVSKYKLNTSALLNQRVGKIVSNEKSDLNFIYYLFKNKDTHTYLANQSSGSANQANISKTSILDLELSFPPLPEQKAIAEVLSSLDDKIDLLHRQNETLEEMAQTLFRQWFVEEADDSWEVKKLGDIMTIASSKRIFYKEYKDFGIPFYRSKEIIELSNTGKTNSELFISEERFNEISTEHGSPQKGDILLTSVGTLGKSYRVKENDLFYFKDGNLTWFKEYDELNSDIVYAWLNSDLGQNALREITIGSTQSALTLTGLRNIELSIPPIEVQEKLNSQLKLIYEKNDTNYLQIQTLEKLRDTLLPKLMSGEVRVNL